jgi:hypothetical protein
MTGSAASVRKAAAQDTLQFDWLLGDKPFFTLRDLAGRLAVSDSFLEKLWDDKQSALHISGHEYNGGKGERNTKRIARAFAVRLLVKSARYNAEEKMLAVLSCASDFSASDCIEIAAKFQAEAMRKQGR